MSPDPKFVLAGLAALGIGAAGAAGYLKIQTPEAAQCQVDLAAEKVRVENLIEIREQCKIALETCASGRTP